MWWMIRHTVRANAALGSTRVPSDGMTLVKAGYVLCTMYCVRSVLSVIMRMDKFNLYQSCAIHSPIICLSG